MFSTWSERSLLIGAKATVTKSSMTAGPYS
jgi:hypothetical protein